MRREVSYIAVVVRSAFALEVCGARVEAWANILNLPGWCWARIKQLALIGSSSSLHSEACKALGGSDGVVHSTISLAAICMRAVAKNTCCDDCLLALRKCTVMARKHKWRIAAWVGMFTSSQTQMRPAQRRFNRLLESMK